MSAEAATSDSTEARQAWYYPRWDDKDKERLLPIAAGAIEHDRQTRCRALVDSVGNVESMASFKKVSDWADAILKWAPDAVEPVAKQAERLLAQSNLPADARDLAKRQLAALEEAIRNQELANADEMPIA